MNPPRIPLEGAISIPDDPPIRVAVVAQELLVRLGVGSVLTDADIEIVGHATPEDASPAVLAAWGADLAVLDLGWAGGLNEGAVPSFMDEVATLVLAATPTDAAAAWQGRARGVIHRESVPAALKAAVRAVASGLRVSDPAFAPDFPGAGATHESVEPLTGRELDVLRLVALGMANKEIARHLDISENTVKFHLNAVLGKMGAHSRTEAAMIGARWGLVPL